MEELESQCEILHTQNEAWKDNYEKLLSYVNELEKVESHSFRIHTITPHQLQRFPQKAELGKKHMRSNLKAKEEVARHQHEVEKCKDDVHQLTMQLAALQKHNIRLKNEVVALRDLKGQMKDVR